MRQREFVEGSPFFIIKINSQNDKSTYATKCNRTAIPAFSSSRMRYHLLFFALSEPKFLKFLLIISTLLREGSCSPGYLSDLLSEMVKVIDGLAQGCQAKFWKMRIELDGEYFYLQDFVDDQVLIATCRFHIQYIQRKLTGTYEKWGLNINIDSPSPLENQKNIEFKGKMIGNVKEYKYLLGSS